MKRMRRIRTILLPVFAVVFASLLMVGCGESEHPKGDHPKAGSAKSEHPKKEHAEGEDPEAGSAKSEHPTGDHPKASKTK